MNEWYNSITYTVQVSRATFKFLISASYYFQKLCGWDVIWMVINWNCFNMFIIYIQTPLFSLDA